LWAIARRSWMLYIGLALSWLPLVVLYVTGYNTPLGGFNNTISAQNWWLTQSNSFFVYWRLLFFPWPLLLHYHVPTLHGFSAAWPGVVGIAIYGLATFYLFWRRTVAGFAMLWFFAVLSPTLIVPLPHEEISERRMYVPLLAMIPFLSIGSFVLIQKLRRSFVFGQAPAVIYSIAFILIGAFTLPRLQDRQTIWLEVLKHQPSNTFALASQGSVEFNRGQTESGLEKIQLAFESDPSHFYFQLLLTKALNSLQLHEQLLETAQRIYSLNPEDPVAAYNLAVAMEKNGRYFEAINAYRDAIRLAPKHDEAHASLATLLAEHDQMAEAVKHFEIATEVKPDFINCMNLTSVYLNTGQHKKAYFTIQKLLVAARQERTPEVVEHVERAMHEMERQLQLRDATQ
jgi:protein O-mannosyl-transferase